MAKRSFSPVLWFLLALMLRADMDAAGQTRYPAPSKSKTSLSAIPASNWKSPQRATVVQTPAAKLPTPVTGRTVDYEISGETYENESYAEEPAPRKRVSRSGSRSGRQPARTFRESDYEDDLQPEFADEQVDYEEGYPGEMDGMEGGDPESGYSGYADESYPEEVWDEEEAQRLGHHTPRSRFFHWLESFKAEHGYWFRTSNNSPPNIGMGKPLKGTSWLNRPNSISFFAGVLNGDVLISNRVDQGSALFGGLRLGWDFDHYWGVEARGGWASPDIEFPDVPPDRVDGIFLCDASVLYYPWGDAACRPYALVGMGMAMFDFTDEFGFVHDEFLLGIPIGFGFKYMYHPNLAFRAEFLDNIACGSAGLNNMNNLSFSLGMELRFGGKPRSYYPWQPAKFIW